MFTRIVFGAIVMMGLLGLSKVASHDARKQSLPSRPERPVAAVRTGGEAPPDEVVMASEVTSLAEMVRANEEEARRAEEERLAAEAAAQAAAAAEAARVAAAQQAPRAAPVSSGAGSGDCAPVAAIVGWGIVNRESGGNPNAQNSSSGAYGCSQTLPSHYGAGGVCAGLDMYSVAGQAACTQILYDRGGLRPWGG